MSTNQLRPVIPSPNAHIQTKYSPKSRNGISFPAQGREHQSFKDECDINTIMGRYLKTGVLPQNLNQREAQYLDVSEIEFQAAAELVAGAKSLFEQMPSSIRERFRNDPAELLAFTNNPKNLEEAARMGLLAPEKAASILNPKPVDPLAPEPAIPAA